MTIQSQSEFLAEWLGWTRADNNEWIEPGGGWKGRMSFTRYYNTGNGMIEILTQMRGESEEVRRRFSCELRQRTGYFSGSDGCPQLDQITPALVIDAACLALGYGKD